MKSIGIGIFQAPSTKLIFALAIYFGCIAVLIIPTTYGSNDEHVLEDSINYQNEKLHYREQPDVDHQDKHPVDNRQQQEHEQYDGLEYDEDDEDEKDVDYNESTDDEIRVVKYYELGYEWPIPDDAFIPNTTDYINHMRKRIEQIDKIVDERDRWTGFTTVAVTGVVIPNFTEHGFGITKCIDEELMEKLRIAIREGYETAELEEADTIMPGPKPPVMVENDELLERVHIELHRYAEAWSGMKLFAYGAYGFRVYREGAQLLMHIDRPETHVISFILHIDHSDDGTPWPLVIEDYHGNTHEVTLETGDLLFYESAKLMHGRPRPFNGTWYSSVFVHYHPAEGWVGRNIDEETSYTIPPGWETQLLEEHTLDVPRMQLVDTGFTEPDCEHEWCGLQNSIKWGGPAEAGVWMAPNMQKYPIDIQPYIPPVRVEYMEEVSEL